MDPRDLFTKTANQANGCVKHIKDDQLDLPTPCSEWNLKQLLNHIVYELLWVPDLLAGKTIAEVGGKYEGDVLKDDYHAAWQKVLSNAKKAIERADLKALVHLSYGDKLAEHYIKEMSAEMLIHGWDVAQAIKCNMIFDEEVTKETYEFAEPQHQSMIDSGIVGMPIAYTTPNPDGQTRLLSLYGRRAERLD